MPTPHNAGTEWHRCPGRQPAEAESRLRPAARRRREPPANMPAACSTKTHDDKRKDLQDTRMEEACTTVVAEYPINYVENDQKGWAYSGPTTLHARRRARRPRSSCSSPATGTGKPASWTWPTAEHREALDTHTWGVDWSHEMQLRNKGWLAFNAQLPVKAQGGRATRTRDGARPATQALPALLARYRDEMASGGGRQEGNKTEPEPESDAAARRPRRHTPAEPDRHLRPAGHVWGNPALRKQTGHGAHIGIAPLLRTPQAQRLCHAGRHKTRDAIGVRSAYDAQSGLRTFMPVNTDGGHKVSVECGYNLPHRRPDLLAQPVGQIKPHTLCQPDGGGRRRHGNRLHAALRLPRPGQPAVEHGQPEGGSVTRHLRRQRHPVRDSPDDKVQDLGNHLAMTFRLPADINVSANCNVVSRFGYSMASLNKTLVLTDAQVSKSVCKGKLELTLSAVDIFPPTATRALRHGRGGPHGNGRQTLRPRLCPGHSKIPMVVHSQEKDTMKPSRPYPNPNHRQGCAPERHFCVKTPCHERNTLFVSGLLKTLVLHLPMQRACG